MIKQYCENCRGSGLSISTHIIEVSEVRYTIKCPDCKGKGWIPYHGYVDDKLLKERPEE
jgi:DnaJ-class molecular chaperone